MQTFLSLFDDTVELTIEVEYEGCYAPARGMGGPWEYSSPDESYVALEGFKVLSLVEHDEDHPPVTDEAINAAWLAAQNRIEQECWDDMVERRYDR